jgi:hypothetical protein
MAIDDKVIEKIRKLLALAGENGFKNDNENESRLAFRKAAELMEAHGLAIADINTKTGEVSNIQNFTLRQGLEKYRVWANSLIACLAKCFDCRVVLLQSSRTHEDDQQVVIGVKSDVDMVIWYYNFLKIRIARGASTKFRLQADQKEYGKGAVAALRVRLEEMFVKVRQEIRTAETTALVVVKNREVEKKFQEMFPKTTPVRHKPVNGSRAAYMQGIVDGQRMGINQPIAHQPANGKIH